MAEKKPSIHKTLFFLILVLVPPYWLLFTDEGGRLSDTALLWLLGETEIKLNVRELNSGFTREQVLQVFSDADWQCGDGDTPFGNSLCAAQIGTFNGFPSRVLTMYFRDQQIGAFKLIYRDPYHKQLLGHFIQQLGQPDNVAAAISGGPDAANVLEWDLGQGLLIMKKELARTDEPSVLWVASRPKE